MLSAGHKATCPITTEGPQGHSPGFRGSLPARPSLRFIKCEQEHVVRTA